MFGWTFLDQREGACSPKRDGELLFHIKLVSWDSVHTVHIVQPEPAVLKAVEDKTEEKNAPDLMRMQEQGGCELARKTFQLGIKSKFLSSQWVKKTFLKQSWLGLHRECTGDWAGGWHSYWSIPSYAEWEISLVRRWATCSRCESLKFKLRLKFSQSVLTAIFLGLRDRISRGKTETSSLRLLKIKDKLLGSIL